MHVHWLLSVCVAATPLLSAAFGQGDGPIAMGNVVCTGTEDQLVNCTSDLNHNCISHSNDVGVRCVTSTSGMCNIMLLEH